MKHDQRGHFHTVQACKLPPRSFWL